MAAFLENMVANALQSTLGAYFDGIDSKTLKGDVFRGQVVLRNVPVREDALAAFQLPYKVRWGVVSTLRLLVPWQKLGREPVNVVIDEAYVLVVPIKGWDKQEFQRMIRKGKSEHVMSALLRQQRTQPPFAAPPVWTRPLGRVERKRRHTGWDAGQRVH